MTREEIYKKISQEGLIADSLNGECILTLNLSSYTYGVHLGELYLKKLDNKDELNWLKDNLKNLDQLADRVCEFCVRTQQIPYIETDF